MKQIKTVCIYRKFEGDVNDYIPINFSEEIKIPYTVRYIEVVASLLVGEKDEEKYQTSCIVNSNLIHTRELCLTSQLSMVSKYKIRDINFNGFYNFNLMGPNGFIYLIPPPEDPFFNKINEAYLTLQIIFYE